MKPPMAGWIGFAAIVMVLIGALTFFEGLIAVIRQHYYVLTGDGVLVVDVKTWGWIMIFWGILLALVGLALMGGSLWARWFTVALASLNTIAELGFLGNTQFPLWSLTVIALNIVVIYMLVVPAEGYSVERTYPMERAPHRPHV